ncbi:malate dehydrogenase [Candidatus Profftella armatura]|jgi:malate dehydrogenase|uniref:Malate dehydrogenase, cytoplasmic n=2 Tax=cellular organisms TaxID=131567 RepID=A0A1S3DIS9_DIACI|nr:malate dehydrogenase [Candidatus Profftella armatura]XP_008482750.1 uncharacterized protein LOC103519440 [Diaphorina citri]AGS06773.1 malate dehydrogenase [Candidatus Profftella armatura]ALC95887.1 malate dehydrogenase [Candidatus Profftella armatura]QLK13685.1 malate dehydrogenase [Candidatus Profftella armatura]
MLKKPVRISITGAAGQIGYNIIFRIANGDLLGKDQPIILQLLEASNKKSQKAIKGVIMEIEDCIFPLLVDVSVHENPITAFKDANIAILIGSFPRKSNMERSELLAINSSIFIEQGKALNSVASRDVKVLVVGNPVNTNTYITMKSAPDLSYKNFTAMLRLDHNRAIAKLASKLNEPVSSIKKVFVWGNHSLSMYPDYRYATVNGVLIRDMINNNSFWNKNVFLPAISRRGEEIISIRGASSAASAASAAIDHIKDWIFGTENWVTMGIPSDGSYNVPKDIIFGFPVKIKNSKYKIIQNLEIDKFSRKKINLSIEELKNEILSISHLIR